MVHESDIFVFLYDEEALSVSGGFELGYWMALQELTARRVHTVVVLMNTMSTTLLKMLPNTTYIHLNEDNPLSLSADDLHDSETNFPGMVRVSSLAELTKTFSNILVDHHNHNLLNATEADTLASAEA